MIAIILGGTPARSRTAHSGGVVDFGEVDKVRGKRVVLGSRQVVETLGDEHHVVGESCRAEAMLLLKEDVLALTAAAQSAGDELEQDFATVRYEGNASVVGALRRVFLLEEHLDGGILPLLRYLPRLLHVGDDVVDLPEENLVAVEEQLGHQLRREFALPTAFLLDIPRIASSTSALVFSSSTGANSSLCLNRSATWVSRVGDLVLRSVRNHLTHRSNLRVGSRDKLPSSSLMLYCRTPEVCSLRRPAPSRARRNRRGLRPACTSHTVVIAGRP